MKRFYSARLALLAALILAPLATAEAGTVHGTVMNGTTGKAAAGIDLVLIQLQGGMQEVAAAGPAGMPVTQLPIDKKNNRYSIAYAFRPGDNSVRYSYELPYPGNAATLKIPTIYPGGRLLVVAPPSVQIRGEGLAPGGQEQGMNLYGREDVPAGTLVAVNVSGTAPPPSEAGAGADQAQQGSGESAGANIQQVPGRLDVLKWPLVIGFVCVFALGALLLARRPVVAVAAPLPADENAPEAKPKKPKPASAAVPPPP